MALVPCRECGKPISTEAPSCPQCGVPEPWRRSPVAVAPPTQPTRSPVPAPLPPAPRQLTPTDRGGSSLGGILAGVVGLLVLIAVISIATAGSGEAGSGSPRATPDAKIRLADSIQVATLYARRDSLSKEERFLLERMVHHHGFAVSHDSLHARFITEALDSAAGLLKPGSNGTGDFHSAEAFLAPAYMITPITEAQQARQEKLVAMANRQRERADEIRDQEAQESRAAMIREGTRCKPSLQKVKRSIERHPAWDDRVIQAIVCGRVFIGMTAEQARAGWGAPDDINRSVYSFGVHEQWVYGEYGSGYLYLEDGIVTSIQN